jgi:CRP-like cAMP-binding protein
MNKAALKAVLGRRDWFAQLDSEFADDILELCRLRRLNDSLIYSASDVADGMFALISGQARMTRVFRSGQLAYLVVASPGAWFGISAAIDGKPYGYDASTIGSTVLFHLSRERMNQAIAERVERFAAIASLLSDHYRVAVNALIAQRNRRPTQILANVLTRLAERHGRQVENGLVIDLHLSQEDLAAMIGVGRQTINRLLKTLERQGVASVNYTSLTIHNIDALQRIRTKSDCPHDEDLRRLSSL